MITTSDPPIVVAKSDLDRLRPFVAMTYRSPVADYLAEELSRARVVDTLPDASDVVRLGSSVRFKDLRSGVARTVTLVTPNEADIDAGRISVLTPVGAALLGLSIGQQIAFTLPNGTERSLRVMTVRNTQNR